MPSPEFVAGMAEALAFLDKVALFYDKYHILECEDRHALQHRLRDTHREWARCRSFEQQHVDFIEVTMRELRLHYQEWIQHERIADKRWRRHPGESLKRMLLESTNTTTRLQEAIAHQSRKLSAVANTITITHRKLSVGAAIEAWAE